MEKEIKKLNYALIGIPDDLLKVVEVVDALQSKINEIIDKVNDQEKSIKKDTQE